MLGQMHKCEVTAVVRSHSAKPEWNQGGLVHDCGTAVRLPNLLRDPDKAAGPLSPE